VNTRLPPGAALPALDLGESWSELDAGRTVVSDLVYGPVAQQWTVAVTVPVHDGRAAYALSLVMLPSTLSRVLSDQTLPEGWVGGILDRSGIVVARSRSPERYVGKPPSPSLAALMSAAPSGSGPSTTLEGEPVITAWSRSPSYGWTFAVGVPPDQLATNSRQAVVIAVVLGVLALAAGAGAAAMVARGITRPHEALERNARALGRGETVASAATGLRATDRVMAAMHAASVALREREGELRVAAARLRATFDSAPAGIAEADREGRIIRANRRQQEITGRGATLIGMTFEDITHPDDAPINRALHRRLLAGEIPSFRTEKRYIRPDGSIVWVDLYVTLVHNAIDAPFALAVAQDISERKEVEAALRDSEARFRTMLEALPHLAFVLRPDGSTEYHNRRVVEYFGNEAAGLAERMALIHPEDRPRLMAAREAGIAAGGEYSAEIRLRRRDGVYRWHASHVRPLRRDGGEIVAWLGTSVDIDDVRRINETLEARVRERTRELETTQETLRQAQKLEAVGQLTGGVAHDFNNLLTVLSGNLDLLDRQVRDASARRLIDAAHRAVQRAAKLTQSLLAFARRQDLHPETVNANRVIKEVSELLRRAAGDRVEVQLLLSPTLDPCRIDATHFEAALLNLVANARDAMPVSGGRISIETENATVGEEELTADPGTKPGRFVCVKVGDTGAGMTPDTLKRAFEPFFTTKDIGKGSGLGLSQVYGFAKQSGGFVRLASEPGIGTTVRLYLPHSEDLVVDRAEDLGAGMAPRAHAVRAEAILVVEDDADVRDTVAEGLRTLGYDVVTAEDGGSALAILERGAAVDLLFTDVSMPRGMGGDELARRAQRLRRGLKILLTSGYAVAARDGALLEQFTVLAKPYRSDDLARAVRAALDD
jgi:PAS domain S-box-containing protein